MGESCPPKKSLDPQTTPLQQLGVKTPKNLRLFAFIEKRSAVGLTLSRLRPRRALNTLTGGSPESKTAEIGRMTVAGV